MSLKIVYRQNRMKIYTKAHQIAPLNKKNSNSEKKILPTPYYIGNTRVSVAYYSFYDNIQLYEWNESNCNGI